jgi:hypothetical protein
VTDEPEERRGRGRPIGTPFSQNARARERIRVARLLTIADEIAEGKIKGDPKRLAVRLQAASMLLRKCLPDMTSVDLTSGGEPFVVERAVFKRGSKKT